MGNEMYVYKEEDLTSEEYEVCLKETYNIDIVPCLKPSY